MDQQPVAELRFEPRRLWRHDVAGVGRPTSGRRRSPGTARTRPRPCRNRRAVRAPSCRARRRRNRSACRCARRPTPEQRREQPLLQHADVERADGIRRRRAPHASAACATGRRDTSRPRRVPHGVAGPFATSKRSRTAARNASDDSPPRSFTVAVVGEDLHLVVRETPPPARRSHRLRRRAARRRCRARAFVRARAALAAR